MALAVLLGCGLAFGEPGSQQRALSNRLDCVTYSGDVGGSVPRVKPPLSYDKLSAISTTPKAFQVESILTQ